jgi:hypothetical protein
LALQLTRLIDKASFVLQEETLFRLVQSFLKISRIRFPNVDRFRQLQSQLCNARG